MQIRRDDNAVWFTIQANSSIMHYIVEKGSIAIDGISLTVASLSADFFCVSILPHTAKVTTLGMRKIGDTVNLENDIINIIAKIKGIELRHAFDIYYSSKLAEQISNDSYGIENMDARYLAEDLMENEPELFK